MDLSFLALKAGTGSSPDDGIHPRKTGWERACNDKHNISKLFWSIRSWFSYGGVTSKAMCHCKLAIGVSL